MVKKNKTSKTKKDTQVEKPVVKKDTQVKKPKVDPKLNVKEVLVCKDEDGKGGCLVKGIVSPDGKQVTTLKGVTFAL